MKVRIGGNELGATGLIKSWANLKSTKIKVKYGLTNVPKRLTWTWPEPNMNWIRLDFPAANCQQPKPKPVNLSLEFGQFRRVGPVQAQPKLDKCVLSERAAQIISYLNEQTLL